MNDIVKCSRCGCIFIAEEFESHECKIPIKKHIQILASSILDITTDEKKKVLIDSLDGTTYFIEEVKEREALPWSPESLQGKKTPDKLTEPVLTSSALCFTFTGLASRGI